MFRECIAFVADSLLGIDLVGETNVVFLGANVVMALEHGTVWSGMGVEVGRIGVEAQTIEMSRQVVVYWVMKRGRRRCLWHLHHCCCGIVSHGRRRNGRLAG